MALEKPLKDRQGKQWQASQNMNNDLEDVLGSPSRSIASGQLVKEDLIDRKMAETRHAQQEIFKEMES